MSINTNIYQMRIIIYIYMKFIVSIDIEIIMSIDTINAMYINMKKKKLT